MPISGLIVHFCSDSKPTQATLQQLRDHPQIQVGTAAGDRLPIVIDTVDAEDSSRMWEWLHSLPGISVIDVAYLHFEDREDHCLRTEDR